MRWDPDSRSKLAITALEMFEERGFENVTVAEIAERAGLTERTFFRHFSDKREVLFAGGEELEALMVAAAVAAPAGAAAIDAVGAAVEAAAGIFEERREYARRRSSVIEASPELRERELIKMARIAASLARTLRERGTSDADAILAAEAGIAVFRVAFKLWVSDPDGPPMLALVSDLFGRLRSLTAAA